MTAFARAALALAFAALATGPVVAATKDVGPSLLPGADSKQPVSIEADKLVYFDKEQKAVYSGNVVVIQGATKLTCSTMTIHMEKTAAAGAPAVKVAADTSPPPAVKAAADASPTPAGQSSRVSHLDCAG